MLDDDPDLKGVSGDGIVKLMHRIDRAQYRAEMAERERKAQQARSDATWDRAIAAVYGRTTSAAQSDHETVWDRAMAHVIPGMRK